MSDVCHLNLILSSQHESEAVSYIGLLFAVG